MKLSKLIMLLTTLLITNGLQAAPILEDGDCPDPKSLQIDPDFPQTYVLPLPMAKQYIVIGKDVPLVDNAKNTWTYIAGPLKALTLVEALAQVHKFVAKASKEGTFAFDEEYKVSYCYYKTKNINTYLTLISTSELMNLKEKFGQQGVMKFLNAK